MSQFIASEFNKPILFYKKKIFIPFILCESIGIIMIILGCIGLYIEDNSVLIQYDKKVSYSLLIHSIESIQWNWLYVISRFSKVDLVVLISSIVTICYSQSKLFNNKKNLFIHYFFLFLFIFQCIVGLLGISSLIGLLVYPIIDGEFLAEKHLSKLGYIFIASASVILLSALKRTDKLKKTG